MTPELSLQLLCGRAPIASYGGGGFRIGQTRCEGAILILADGVYAWDSPNLEAQAEALSAAAKNGGPCDFFLYGSGVAQIFASETARATFDAAELGIEAMATGAACRTYNILLAEQRNFAAGFLPV